MSESNALNEYELVEATTRDLVEFTRLENGATWRGLLPIDHYVTREDVLAKCVHALPSESKILVFVMRHRKTQTPVSSVELLIRKHWRFDYHDGKVVQSEIQSGCIGGVFTYPDHRRQGHAKVMIDKLIEVAKKQYLSPHGFLYLYSEVGEYYSANGFKSVPVDLIEFHPNKTFPSFDEGECFELIDYHGFEEVATAFNKQAEQTLLDLVESDHLTRVSIVPEPWIYDWFHIRAKFISYMLFHEKSLDEEFDFASATYQHTAKMLASVTPKKFGIKLLDGEKKTIGYISWTIDWKSPTENHATVLLLVVFRGHDKDSNSIKLLELLRHYLATAKEDNEQHTVLINLWETEVSEAVKHHMAQSWGAKTGIENSSRSAILFGDKNEQEKFLEKQIIWELNTKLSWF